MRASRVCVEPRARGRRDEEEDEGAGGLDTPKSSDYRSKSELKTLKTKDAIKCGLEEQSWVY